MRRTGPVRVHQRTRAGGSTRAPCGVGKTVPEFQCQTKKALATAGVVRERVSQDLFTKWHAHGGLEWFTDQLADPSVFLELEAHRLAKPIKK